MAPHYLAELTSALDEIEPLAIQIADLKKSVQEQEAKALGEILKRVWQLMPALTAGKLDGCYRGQIVLIERMESAKTGPGEGFDNSTRLIFYEDQRLMLVHGVSYWGSRSKTCTICEEFELSCLNAVQSFGLEPIATNILKELQTADSLTVLKDEEQARLEDVSKALEVLGCTQ